MWSRTGVKMSHSSIALRLSKTDTTLYEGVQVLASGSRWQSPGGGWMGIRTGICKQQPDGLHLFDATGMTTAAICRGLNFLLCQEGMTGTAIYPSIGDAGAWLVAATID